MPDICLTFDQFEALVKQAQSAFPEEACGLLAGEGQRVLHLFSITNIADDPTTHYVMSPNELLKTLKQIDALGLDFIGTYHSHPSTPPIPSPTDIRDAAQNLPDKIHIIISLNHNHPQLKAWRIGQHQVDHVDIQVGKQKAYAYLPENSLQLQQGAVILSALCAVALLLLISFTLLPPAPSIP